MASIYSRAWKSPSPKEVTSLLPNPWSSHPASWWCYPPSIQQLYLCSGTDENGWYWKWGSVSLLHELVPKLSTLQWTPQVSPPLRNRRVVNPIAWCLSSFLDQVASQVEVLQKWDIKIGRGLHIWEEWKVLSLYYVVHSLSYVNIISEIDKGECPSSLHVDPSALLLPSMVQRCRFFYAPPLYQNVFVSPP